MSLSRVHTSYKHIYVIISIFCLSFLRRPRQVGKYEAVRSKPSSSCGVSEEKEGGGGGGGGGKDGVEGEGEGGGVKEDKKEDGDEGSAEKRLRLDGEAAAAAVVAAATPVVVVKDGKDMMEMDEEVNEDALVSLFPFFFFNLLGRNILQLVRPPAPAT